ncbi:MAG: response regulator [Anaerolineales bacterium]
MKKTHILLAEDHTIVRQGLRRLLTSEDDFEIVGEAETGLQAISLVERLRPDVLVLDIMMSEMNGIDVARWVKKNVPATRVVILSMHDSEAFVVESLRAGALAYLLKQTTSDELVQAIHHAMQGQRFLSPSISDQLINNYVLRFENETFDIYETLTPREREVFNLVAEGHTNSEIAEKLSISVRTVERHRTNFMHKLELDSQTDLIRYAIQRGVIPLSN